MSTTGASAADGNVVVGTIADIDNLTSLTYNASGGDITSEAIGATGTGEKLATIDIDAADGATLTIAAITMDTTDSAVGVAENALTFTIDSDASSDVNIADFNNQYGTVTGTLAGAGVIDFTTGTSTIAGEAVTLTLSGSGAKTIDEIDPSGNVSITSTNTGAVTITDLQAAGATKTVTIDASGATGAHTINADHTGNVTITTGSGADDIDMDGATATGYTHTATLGGGADTFVGGTGAETVSGGDGNDTIDTTTGNDSIDAGAGNDTLTFNTAGDLTAADTVDGGDGTDSLTLTISANLTPVLTSVENIDLTTTGGTILNLSSSSATTRVDVENGSGSTLTVKDMASGGSVRILDANTTLTADTTAGGSITIDSHIDNTAGVTVTDAASVTVKSSHTGSTDSGDITSLALDNTDTTSLTVTGSSDADADVDTGAVTNTNVLETVTITSALANAVVAVASIVDADALTSLTMTGSGGNITLGNTGTSGSAETLSTIALTASSGADVQLTGTVSGDTTDSTTDQALTITADAATSSNTDLGTITHTYGALTVTQSGAGTNDSTALTADDVTLTCLLYTSPSPRD